MLWPDAVGGEDEAARLLLLESSHFSTAFASRQFPLFGIQSHNPVVCTEHGWSGQGDAHYLAPLPSEVSNA